MGCASSKRVEAAVDYKPAPASFAVFDINGVQEPWLGLDNTIPQEEEELAKPVHVPAQILDKLDESDAAPPQTWDEVNKALENLKPNLSPKPSPKPVSTKKKEQQQPQEERRKPRKSLSYDSFHTLEELDNKTTAAAAVQKASGLKKSESMRSLQQWKKPELNRSGSRALLDPPSPDTQPATGFRSVKENIFIQKDRMERQKEGQVAVIDKLISLRDPLSDYPEKCPPGGAESVVIYTTSLRGVRRTYEDCQRVKSVFEVNRLVYDERDVSLHGEFLTEMKGLIGEGVGVPRVFVKGRYVGGVEEVVELNESGRLGRMVKWARVETGPGPQACGGCGGARFVPCMECGGSCKVVVGDKKARCPKCNENGLVYCVACWSLT